MTKYMIAIVGGYIALTGAVLGGNRTIYSQDFSGSYSALSNTVVTYGAGSYSGNTWNAVSALGTDGSLTNNAGVQGGARLAFVPELNIIYQLNASFRGMNSGYDFYAAGFVCSDAPAEGDSPLKSKPNGLGYLTVAPNGTVDAWGYKNVSGQKFASSDLGSGADMDLRVEITKVAGPKTYNITWYAKEASSFDYTELYSTNNFSFMGTITGVGFGIDENSPPGVQTSGKITAFNVYQIFRGSCFSFK